MMATAGPPSASSLLPLLETLEDGAAGQSEQTDAYLTIASRLSGEEGRQFLPAVEKNFSRLAQVILAHTGSSNPELSQAALQALGFCVYHSQVASGVSETLAAQILSTLCSLVTKSTDKNTCTRALWVISKQSFPADAVGKNVPAVLGSLESVWSREDIQSAVMEHEALNVVIRMLEQVPAQMCEGAERWAKLLVPLVVHSASKVRLRAAAALEMGMPLLLARQTEVAAVIEPMMSTKLIPELQKLFMSKNETNVLKLWPLFVKLLGKLLHKGGPFINSLLHLEELGFRSSSPTIKKIAFIAWKSLIDNFALNPDILCSSKRMKLLMQPLTSIHVRTEALLLTKVEVWWYLIVQLGPNLSSNFDQVSVPLLQSTIGSDSSSVPSTPSRAAGQNGAVTPSTPKSGNSSFNASASTPRMGLNSSMQLPSSYSSIQLLGLEMLLHYFLGPEVVAAAAKNKLILSLEPLNHPLLSGAPSFVKHAAVLISSIRDGFINVGKDAPEPLLAHVWTSLVRFVNLTIESGSKKERQGCEVLTLTLQALQSVVSSEALPAHRVLALLEATVKGLPQRVLGSASYQVGKMDVLNGTPALFVVLLLFNSSDLSAYVEDERFFHCLQTLVSCGLSGPTSPLAFAEAVLGAVSGRAASVPNKEQLWRMWSAVVGPLTDTITQSNEVNQGDALEHDFSAMHSALMFPVSHLLPGALLQQASQKSLLSLWSKLYRVFARCAALVVTAEENICCEELCAKMAAALDGEALTVPPTLSAVCSLLQVMVECVDFSPYSPHFQQKLKSPHTPVNWTRRRSKALGNLSSFLSLLAQCLQVYLQAPRASSEATGSALASVVSTLFANMVLANAVTEALSVLVQPLSLFYKQAASDTDECSAHLQGKLEKLLCELLGCLQSRSTLAYDDELLALLAPLLCVVFPHKSKHLRTAVTQFWNATFANTVSLTYPEEIRPVLSQVKQKTPIILPGFEAVGVPDELSETFSSESSQLETKLSGMPVSSAGKRDSMLSPSGATDRSSTKTSKPVSTKLDFGSPKPPRREVLEEEASIDFVFIPPETKERVLTEHQKEVKRTKRVDIPAMYNNLDASLDTTVFSQYTQSQDDSRDQVPTQQVDGVATGALSETEENRSKVDEILSKETQDYASPRDDEKTRESQPEGECILDSADVSLEDPAKSPDRTEDTEVETKDSPNTSASSDLVSGTPQKPSSSRRQSFITLEKYSDGKPASPSSVSSFTGPLVKTSNSQDNSSAEQRISSEPNSQGSTPLPQCSASESPRRPKESRSRSEPVRLIDRLQSDSTEDEEAIPDTQTKEDREDLSYSEEINSSSQDEGSLLDDSQTSQSPASLAEPRRSKRPRVRPQLPGEDPEEREAKYTNVKRRRSREDGKSEPSSLTPSRPNTRSKQAAEENIGRSRLRSSSQINLSNSQEKSRKKIKLYSFSEDLLGSPERKRRSFRELGSSQTDIKSEALSSPKNRKRDQISKAPKEPEAERANEGSSQTVTESPTHLIRSDDDPPSSDSQTVIPLAQSAKAEEVTTEQDEGLKKEKALTCSQNEDKSQESICSNSVTSSPPLEESKDETKEPPAIEATMQDIISAIETVIANCSQEDSQDSSSAPHSQIQRRSMRGKALAEAESEGKDEGVNSSRRSRSSRTSTPVGPAEAGVGGRTRRSKLGESSPILTPESSPSLIVSGSGTSQDRGRHSRLRSSQSLASSLESSESESSEVLQNSIRKKRGRKARVSLQSPLTLESKVDGLEKKEDCLEKLSDTDSEHVTESKTEQEENSESPKTEAQAALPLETEAPRKVETDDTNQENKSLDHTELRDSNSDECSPQGEMLESAVLRNTSRQDPFLPTEEKLQATDSSEETGEKVSESEHEVTAEQLESTSDQQELLAAAEEEPSTEELRQSQMECAQLPEEEELPAPHSPGKEDAPLQDNTAEDEPKTAPDTEPSADAGADCSPAQPLQAPAQESPVKQKDLEATAEPDVVQSPSNGLARGTWSPSASPSTSILKKGQKRPLEVETTSPLVKSRRVSFANPIQQQETADDIDRRSPAVRTSSPRRSKVGSVSQPKHISTPTKGMLILSPRNLHSPGYRSSKKCLISEMGQEPRAVPRDCIYPSLVGCSAPVEAVLSQISSTMWSRGFGQLIRSRNIKSVGDLCALTPSEIKTLPIRSPKISNVRKALKGYEQQRKGRGGDELKSFDEMERMTSEPEETETEAGRHDDEEKTSAEALATELVDGVFSADEIAHAAPTLQEPDGEQKADEAPVPAAALPAAVDVLSSRMTPTELGRCSAQQLVEMHERLGGMMGAVVAELQTRLDRAGDRTAV